MNGLNLSPFTDEDMKNHQILDDLLSKNVKWEGSTQDMIKLYRTLVWYAQLKEKIKSSIVSGVKVTNMEQPQALQQIESPKPKKSKGGE